MQLRQAALRPSPLPERGPRSSCARTQLFASVSVADDEVKLSVPQAQNLGIRVTHPVSSRTDQTLPYPAQIVIPTPQLWVVSAPVAGMVANLAIARGDRVTVGQPLVTLESPMHR